ncbi:hypothetical protein EPI10_024165 [Gossypium australe]|uniref:Uncharacterized protein n=1 Tax=Gossypium australe TaxID=47621 RepID=A0A5B6VXX1_9ROSI|nr:hypothetical protein EPI10_024165 [Gossypium australe]
MGGNLLETNIRERLDRGMTNTKWMDKFRNVTIHHLLHSFSDYCLILDVIRLSAKRFRFEAW